MTCPVSGKPTEDDKKRGNAPFFRQTHKRNSGFSPVFFRFVRPGKIRPSGRRKRIISSRFRRSSQPCPHHYTLPDAAHEVPEESRSSFPKIPRRLPKSSELVFFPARKHAQNIYIFIEDDKIRIVSRRQPSLSEPQGAGGRCARGRPPWRRCLQNRCDRQVLPRRPPRRRERR